jgi:hypothetical protein
VCDDWFFIPYGYGKYHTPQKMEALITLSQTYLVDGGAIYLQMHPDLLCVLVRNRGLWPALRKMFHFKILSTPDELNRNPLWRASMHPAQHPEIRKLADGYSSDQYWEMAFEKQPFLLRDSPPEVRELIDKLPKTPHVFLMLTKRYKTIS